MVGRGVYAIRCIRPLFFFSLGNYKPSGYVYWGGGGGLVVIINTGKKAQSAFLL